LTKIAQDENPDFPAEKTFLLGHSMGALIAIAAAMRAPKSFSGVILSAPPLAIDETVAPQWQRDALERLAQALPKLPMPNIPLETLCRDQGILDLYVNDPLINHGLLTARLVRELFRGITKV